MLELRLTADAKRIASMRDAIRRECARAKVGPEHVETIVFVAEQLALGDRDGDDGRGKRRRERRSELFVILTVQSDATMLMVRDAKPHLRELGPNRLQLLHDYTSSWSTMSGRDGRTIWAEIPRGKVLAPAAPAVAPREVEEVDVRSPALRPVPCAP
jgi:hypothetical protein